MAAVYLVPCPKRGGVWLPKSALASTQGVQVLNQEQEWLQVEPWPRSLPLKGRARHGRRRWMYAAAWLLGIPAGLALSRMVLTQVLLEGSVPSPLKAGALALVAGFFPVFLLDSFSVAIWGEGKARGVQGLSQVAAPRGRGDFLVEDGNLAAQIAARNFVVPRPEGIQSRAWPRRISVGWQEWALLAGILLASLGEKLSDWG